MQGEQNISPPPVSQSVRLHVMALALPAVGEQLLNTLVGLADVYMTGNLTDQAAATLGYGSVTAMAGVGLGNQMVWLIRVLFIAAGTGSIALIARAVGANNEADKQRFLRQSILNALLIGILGTLLVGLLGRPFLLALGAPDNVLPRSEEYLTVISMGVIPASLLFVGMACMRGAGDTRTPLYIMLGVNLLNVFVTWLLVSGNLGFPALGVVGAATGTIVAWSVGCIVVLTLLGRGRSGLWFDFRLQPDMDAARRLLRVSTPTAGELLVFHGALLIFTRFVTGLGTVSYAAHVATINVESLSFLPGLGYAAAAAALVGQGLGARSPERAELHAYEALKQGIVMMSTVGALVVLFPHVFLGFFAKDPDVVAAGTLPLIAAGLVQPALAVNFILNGALRGAGDTRWPLYSRLLGTWTIRLPVTWLLVLVLGFGLNGIWLAMCIDFTTQALLALWRFRSGYWQRVEV